MDYREPDVRRLLDLCGLQCGFFLGIGLGWFPALVIACVSAAVWPLIPVATAVLLMATAHQSAVRPAGNNLLRLSGAARVSQPQLKVEAVG